MRWPVALIFLFFASGCLVLHQVDLKGPGTVEGKDLNRLLQGQMTGAFYQGALLFGRPGQQESAVAQAAVVAGRLFKGMVGARDDGHYTLQSALQCSRTVERGGAVVVARVFDSLQTCPLSPAVCEIESGSIFPAAFQSAFLLKEHSCDLKEAGMILAVGDIHY